MRGFSPAAAVLVIGGHRRVVVAANAGNRPLAEQRYYLIWPRGVAGEIAEMIDGVDVLARIDVGQDGAQCREVGVDIGDQRVAHQRQSLQSGLHESGPQHCATGFVARTNAPMNFPSIWEASSFALRPLPLKKAAAS